MSSVELRGLLYEVAAAISRPRRKPWRSGPLEPMDDAAAERLRASALSQKQLRRIVAQGIVLWRDRLQLEDAQLEPILARMRYFIQRFESRHGDLHFACAGKQWAKLKVAVASTSAESIPLQQTPRLGPTAKQPNASTTKGGCYTPNEGIRSLPFVKQRAGCSVILFCKTCQRSITSDWFLENTVGETCLLIPGGGHRLGGNKVCGKYAPKDGTIETRNDNMYHLKEWKKWKK